MQRKGAITLNPNPKTHPSHREACAGHAAALADSHAFKCLDAFLLFFALSFLQPHVYFHSVASTEVRKVLAQLRLMDFLYNGNHLRFTPKTPAQLGSALVRQTLSISDKC